MLRRNSVIPFVAFILLCLLVIGCDNFFVDENTTTSFPVYTANSGAGNISAFQLNPDTGALTAVSGSPFGSGPSPSDLGTDSSGTFLFSANAGGGVSGWTINASGTLGSVAGSPFQPGTNFLSIAVDPSRRFVYAGVSSATTIQGFSLNSNSGVLTTGVTTATVGNPLRMTEDPAGKFLFVAEGASGVEVFTIAGDGTLTQADNVVLAAANDVAVSPNGNFLYVANGSVGVNAFTFDGTTGVLTPIGAGSIAAGTTPVALTVSPNGQMLLVANSGSDNVSSYTISGTTGDLTSVAGSPFAAGAAPSAVAVDPSSRYVYVTNKTAGNISLYTVDTTTLGKLNANGTTTTGNSPNAVLVAP